MSKFCLNRGAGWGLGLHYLREEKSLAIWSKCLSQQRSLGVPVVGLLRVGVIKTASPSRLSSIFPHFSFLHSLHYPPSTSPTTPPLFSTLPYPLFLSTIPLHKAFTPPRCVSVVCGLRNRSKKCIE